MRAAPIWWPRLRWRMRGAWQWPTFFAGIAIDSAILLVLPFQGDPDLPGAILVAGFANVLAVALVAPVVGWLLRRRRPDLPRIVARDYAGTGVLLTLAAAFLVGGLVNRSAARSMDDEQDAAVAAMHAYVMAQAPAYRAQLPYADALRIAAGLYRVCVPEPQAHAVPSSGLRSPADRALCLFATTDQHPAGVRVDGSRVGNARYRVGLG